MAASTRASCVLEANNHLGETPLWSAPEQALYWVNCEQAPQIHRWRPDTGCHELWAMQERVGGIALRSPGQLLVVLSHGIYDFDTRTGDMTLRASSPLPAHVSLHECQCDRQGRLWVGAYDHHFTPANRHARGGAIFRLDGHQLVAEIHDISVANGMAFSPDGKTFYVADSPTRKVNAFDLDPLSGTLANRRTFVELADGEGFVDGATVDAQGAYWLAAVGAGSLRRYLPDGVLDRVLELPISNPTKPAFGGPAMDTLYVTSTRLKIGKKSEENGGIYALKPGVQGIPEPVFVG